MKSKVHVEKYMVQSRSFNKKVKFFFEGISAIFRSVMMIKKNILISGW
jgi:hypothetical protein